MSDHLIEVVAAEVSSDPSAARAVKLLNAALANGWTENNVASLVLRLKHPDGLPMFVAWRLLVGNNGKTSWRFDGARASNGQAMTLNDAFAVVETPQLIFPEPPERKEEVKESDCAG